MNFNTELFVNNKIKKFREATSIPDLSVGEAHAILKWNGIKPIRLEKNKSGKDNAVYSRNEVEKLLRTFPLLMAARERILKNRRENSVENNKEEKPTIIQTPKVYEKPNYYATKEMGDESDRLLKQQEVWFDDDNDDMLYEKLCSKHFYITEKQYKKIQEKLLTENRESKNMSKARNLLYQQGYSQEDAQKTIEAIRNDIPNARLADCKFIAGVTRMYLNRELSDGNAIMKLNKTLKYVASDAHVNEYDNNLNGLSVNDLVERFAGVQQQDADASRAESYEKEHTRNADYTIVRIPDAETAAKYGDYTSWCVTHSENMYNSYTNNGTGLFYFCLKNGFENEQRIVGKGCPLDSYGLSMIAVSVTMDGELNTCTCRWNHDDGGKDNIMDKNQLEELLGVNFYEVFKPYSREELRAKGIIPFDEVPELLAQGKKPEEIFNWIGSFFEGYAKVWLNNKWNLINTNGELLSPNLWFDMVDNNGFYDGYAKVKLNNKWNFINTNGELLWKKPVNEWFDEVYRFYNGSARVISNGKRNLINTNGELLWKKPVNEWFDEIGYFSKGYADVKLNNKWNLINTNGELLWKKPVNEWFDEVRDFFAGYAKVKLNNKWNLINTNGELLWKKPVNEWFDEIGYFSNGYAEVKLNNKWNLINTNGELLWKKPVNEWFDEVRDFFAGYAQVQLNSDWYRLRSDGVLCDYNTREPIANQQMISETKKQKHFYITEKQYKYFKQRLINEGKVTTNDYGEEQEEISTGSTEYKKIKECINFENKSRLSLSKVNKIKKGKNHPIHFIAEIFGGLNGSGKWTQYLKDIETIFKRIKKCGYYCWLVDLDNDCPDDVWTLNVGFKLDKNKLNEGCWGYEPFDSDQTLDECNVFAKKTLDWIIDNIHKKIKNNKNVCDCLFGYLGIIAQLLNTDSIFEEYLYGNDEWFSLKSAVEDAYKYCEKHKEEYSNPNKFYINLKKIKKEIDDLLNKKYSRKNIEKKTKKKINESSNFVDTNKILMVKNFLDKNLVKASISIISNDGLPQKKPVFGLKTQDGEVVKNLTPEQTFYLIQDKFKNIYGDKEKRNKLLKQILIDWYNGKITKEGLLSVNQY